MMKIFKNLTKLLIFGIFALNQAQAQTFPWGSYQKPFPDSSFLVRISEGILLTVDATAYDSLVWQTNLGTKFGTPLVATEDVAGRVLMKKNAKWTFRDVSFKGIRKSGDTLITPSIQDAEYTWSRNGNELNAATSKLKLSNTIGIFSVNIQVPLLNETVAYTYIVEAEPLPGTSISKAISDPTIFSQDLNKFSVNTPADSIVWDINGSKNYDQSPNYYALSNLNGSLSKLYVKKAGVWKFANLAFSGISTGTSLLEANVIAENATYTWYKNDMEIQQPNSPATLFTGTATYKLNVSWTSNPNVGSYSRYIDKLDDPMQTPDLIVRNGNTYSINSKYAPDSVIWQYSVLNSSLSTVRSSNAVVTIDDDILMTATIYQNNTAYTQKNFFYKIRSPFEKGSYQNPADSIFILKAGISFTVKYIFDIDSIDWSIKNTQTGIVRSSNLISETINSDADVSVKVKSRGIWYKEHFIFKGIAYDSLASVLNAPVINSALYQWYFNGQLLTESAAQLTATQPGTYEVVVTWTESGSSSSNSRVEEVTKTATYTFVVTPKMVTGLNEITDQNGTALQLFPNPAVDFVSITNVNGSFTYSICSVDGNEVVRGQSEAHSHIDISGLENGVYMMNIKTQFSQVTKRIIVK